MIPNIVHFNYGLENQEEDFLFAYYIAVLSCKLINSPEEIFFHFDFEPKGIWWEKTKKLVKLIKIKSPDFIGNKKIIKTAHKSDFVRMFALYNYGGIYLDIDTICVRNYYHLLNNKFLMAKEVNSKLQNMGLCNAIMMSEPKSKFLDIWMANYEANFKPEGWQEASMHLPYFLAFNPDEGLVKSNDIKILEPDVFYQPDYMSLDLIFEKENTIPDNLITLHLWNSYSKKYLSKIDNFDWAIENKKTLYGRCILNLFNSF